MSTLTTSNPSRGLRLPTDWWGALFNTLVIVGLGVLMGSQYLEPDKRVLAVSAAVLVLGVAWRLNTVTGLCVLVLLLPFPRGTVFGSTNLAMILLMLVIWMLRFSTGAAARPRPTPLDAPLVALVMAYVISFYNVDPRFVDLALFNFILFVSCLLFYVMIVNNVRTERDLRRLHGFMMISYAVIFMVCLFELVFPGRALVPGWIEFTDEVVTEGANVHNQRILGPFKDYELLSDFCALQLLFFTFLFARARSIGQRTLLGVMTMLDVIVLVATATRGAVVALAVGILYLAYLSRRRIRLIPLVIFGSAGVLVVTIVAGVIMRVTHVANLFERFSETTFVNGMPDSRAGAWTGAFERFLMHPIIGWGPHYSLERGLEMWFWPHCLYLYVANCFGVVGLSVFLWLLWRIWRQTTPHTDSLSDSSYANGYLLVARVQFVVFLIDQIKIEYLRNSIYQFEIWIMFSSWIAASMIRAREERMARGASPA